MKKYLLVIFSLALFSGCAVSGLNVKVDEATTGDLTKDAKAVKAEEVVKKVEEDN